ncbi:MAG: endonuclease/exonuclease/phosphatase family metal-dependent hydrolase [Pseudoalteromonas rhizosphaerae]|jgi:endonuclease/exonuclease/phosphatase family metal-dependent hydrolase|uniref:Endonuclease/exonuclease/phosphatase family protein n=1 Tax=Pseudoalteromonas neustonica TaxID=1840331 RepID=A0ABY3FJP4_9GAMM|nr:MULTISPECIES: endonuclease/exonuclease/phosphatase family protein [Pseudoalteromonas]MBB1294835.1 endonuclease/exonuclease/phosphatase family protein [Pseudoalteromonas sp. SR41-4]MBB1399149.1 endonuclease/exonuclease/phosphatase family protein [Pseudoalteromonas sp. SG44-8]TVU86618.1 endonuclease/exonuclease/phosphatase family protein [Pseudoalteromonas neustonica]|tara:strand:+ start:6171 stop:7340 length:1170 start_codon:yes stop_codon:yes gene_type:complete
MKKQFSIATLACLLISGFSNSALAASSLRVATFNVSMDATNYAENDKDVDPNGLVNALQTNHPQIKNIAEIIQRIRPDILLLNEFDYVSKAQGIDYFKTHYLAKSQNKQPAIDYPYSYVGPVNTGLKTPFDLDNDGQATGIKGDAFGFGFFEGHYGMAVLSRYPIDFDKIRTLQTFKYKDMPNAKMPIDPTTGENWYNNEEWQALRLSSKSFWDIPVTVKGKTLHVIASHPTPPVFDGAEDRNGLRNHDEVRLIKDYIASADYLYDDHGVKGGLAEKSRFVIVGDLNAAPEGDKKRPDTTDQLLKNSLINSQFTPTSKGAKTTYSEKYAAAYTAYWQARADYVLPSTYGIEVHDGGVFWPTKSSELYRLIKDRNASSDHRMVWLDISIK